MIPVCSQGNGQGNGQQEEIFKLLGQLKDNNIIQPLDYHFALFLYGYQNKPLLALAGALVSHALGKSNTCIDLAELTGETLFNLPEEEHQLLLRAVNTPVEHWHKELATCAPVGSGEPPTPLVLWGKKLYLHRYWGYENRVANWIKRQKTYSVDTEFSYKVLNRLFPDQVHDQSPAGTEDKSDENSINWQKVAIAMAASSSFTLISGGPGTGKTTVVIRLMAFLLESSTRNSSEYPSLQITLAAPTGKAAARLSDSIRQAAQTLNCSESIKELLPMKAITLHHLLGAIPGKTSCRYNAENPLHMDVLIVDEASMINLTMMAHLVSALPPDVRVILLGDRNQLASVEAGCLLNDICCFSTEHYGSSVTEKLARMTGEQLIAADPDSVQPSLSSHICLLRKSFRFNENSGIGHLATAVNSGEYKRVEYVWAQGFSDIQLYAEQNNNSAALLRMAVKGYSPYLEAIQKKGSPEAIHKTFNQFRVLAAIRLGSLGVEGLNGSIKKALIDHGLLLTEYAPGQNKTVEDQTWYHGRPVMITRNEPALHLFNGDIGITLLDAEGKLRVSFIMPDGSLKMIIPSRLPEHETVFAMTIHKSQGSEFDHTVLVLPDEPTPILTRELLYTGITRARKTLDIFGHKKILKTATVRQVQRTSGIVEKLLDLSST